MKKSRISPIRLVKQKKVSASACSETGESRQSRLSLFFFFLFFCYFHTVSRTSPCLIRVAGEGVIYRPNYLIHTLHVTLAGIQFGVQEEYSLQDLPMRLTTFGQRRVILCGLSDGDRYLKDESADVTRCDRTHP